MKRCYKCETEKDLCEFSSNKNKQDGLNSECKECQKKYFSEYYSKNKNLHIKRVQKVINNKKNYIAEQKINSGCARCGYNKHPAALHFHHKNPNDKNFGIANYFGKNIDSIIEEISKCEVLCANCHAIEHSKSLYYFKKEKPTKPTKKRYEKRKKKPKELKHRLKKSNIPDDETLKKLLFEIPSQELSKQFNCSDSYLSKYCKKRNIKKPPRGYWTNRD